MADKPRWQELQEAWNALVPAAEAAGIPRIRPVKIGAESIKYRQDRLDTLRSQLRARGMLADAKPNPGPISFTPGHPATDPAMQPRARAADVPVLLPKISPGSTDYYLRHEMKLRSFDVAVYFNDDYSSATGLASEVLLVQARSPLEAINVAQRGPNREWPAEKLLAVTRVEIK